MTDRRDPGISRAADAAESWLAVGRVLGAFGVRGEIKVEPWAPAADSVLNVARHWRFVVPDGQDFGPAKQRLLDQLPFSVPATQAIATVRVQGESIVARLDAPLTREQAEALKGFEIRVDRAAFPPAAEDEFYHADLIGCEAVNTAGERLGRIVDIDDQGVQTLLRLEGGMLIPFVAAHVLDVRLAAREVLVDWGADWL